MRWPRLVGGVVAFVISVLVRVLECSSTKMTALIFFQGLRKLPFYTSARLLDQVISRQHIPWSHKSLLDISPVWCITVMNTCSVKRRPLTPFLSVASDPVTTLSIISTSRPESFSGMLLTGMLETIKRVKNVFAIGSLIKIANSCPAMSRRRS